MNSDRQLTEIFDRGLSIAPDSLSTFERELFASRTASPNPRWVDFQRTFTIALRMLRDRSNGRSDANT